MATETDLRLSGKLKMTPSGLRFQVALCALLVTLCSGSAFADQFDDLALEESAPDLALRDLGDRRYTLSDERGQTVVIQFGSSTTLPYLEQIKPMNELIRKYRGERVTFLTVYTAEQTGDWQADEYFAKYQRADGLRFQVGTQSGERMGSRILVDDMDETVHKAYGAVSTGVFIVDEDGRLAFKARMATAADIEKALAKVLGE